MMQQKIKISKNKHIILGISNKKDGSLRLINNDQKTEKNRLSFFSKLDIKKEKIFSAELVHKDKITIIKNHKKNVIKNCDGLVSKNPNTLLTVTVADCLPVYFYDSTKNIIGIVHAGWRGLELMIIPKMIKIFRNKYKSKTTDIKIVIGPHIQKCHFEIKNDLVKKFKKYNNSIIRKKNKIFLNLSLIAKQQMLMSKIPEKNIKTNQECTYCLKDKYFSYRRDGEKNFQTMASYIALIEK